MIIVSGGMQKSGSGWIYNMLHDMLNAAYGEDSRRLRKEYALQNVLIDDNCFVPRLDANSVESLLPLLLQGRHIIVKTHNYPDETFFASMKRHGLEEQVRLLYSYRDPRDIVLSVIDHGRVQTDHPRMGFANDIKKGLMIVFGFLVKAEPWLVRTDIPKVQYEKINAMTFETMKGLVAALDLDIPEETVRTVTEKYDKRNLEDLNDIEKSFDRIHYNKARSYRYKEEMSTAEIRQCSLFFRYYLQAMGYEKMQTQASESLLSGRDNTAVKNRFIAFQENYIREQEKIILELKRRACEDDREERV